MVAAATGGHLAGQITRSIERDGYAVVERALSFDQVGCLAEALDIALGSRADGGAFSARGLMERIPEVAALARSIESEALVAPVLGANWRPVKATYFDKTPAANWKVPWHQDLTIAVRERRELVGFGPWSVKAGIPHVQPPVEVLERMLAVRFALDDNDASNGPLRVLPRTHLLGRLSPDRIASLREERKEIRCCVQAGGAVLMSPLLLHASSSMRSGARRRVIHIEYAGRDLPGGLEWRT